MISQTSMKKVVVWLLMIVTAWILSGCWEQKDPNEWWVLDSFAQCLNDAWIKMYGTEWCPHCQNQKRQFWSAFAKVAYIDCDAQKVQCEVAKIQWYPTWVFQWQQYQWEQPLSELAKITSCELPSTTK